MPSVDDKWLSLVNSYSLKMVRSFHVYGFKICPWDLCFRLRLLICSFASPGKTKCKIRLFRLIAIKNFAVEYLMTFFLFKKVRFKNVCLATCVIQVFFFFHNQGSPHRYVDRWRGSRDDCVLCTLPEAVVLLVL